MKQEMFFLTDGKDLFVHPLRKEQTDEYEYIMLKGVIGAAIFKEKSADYLIKKNPLLQKKKVTDCV